MHDFFTVLNEHIANEQSEHSTHDAKSLLGIDKSNPLMKKVSS